MCPRLRSDGTLSLISNDERGGRFCRISSAATDSETATPTARRGRRDDKGEGGVALPFNDSGGNGYFTPCQGAGRWFASRFAAVLPHDPENCLIKALIKKEGILAKNGPNRSVAESKKYCFQGCPE
jgi:hypothetical protein